ncbi:hypothetical protein KR032_012062, partial [Drosophila birchii]
GSTAHGIRMDDDKEYEMMIELEFPNYDQILVQPDQHRPGMVQLCFNQLDSHNFVKDTLLDHRGYMKHEEIRIWMDSILSEIDDRPIWDSNRRFVYRLHYEYRGNCHTIMATSVDNQFSINFVPAIKVRFEGVDLQVVPKSVPGPKRSSKCTFMVSNINGEVMSFKKGGAMIKKAVMLLKALCESYGLPKIRSYHLVSLALWSMECKDIKEYKLEDIFHDVSTQQTFSCNFMSNIIVFLFSLQLLYDLCDALADQSLPYFLYEDLNLLSNFKPHQLAEYEKILNGAYTTLKTYPHQQTLSFERCSWHFY